MKKLFIFMIIIFSIFFVSDVKAHIFDISNVYVQLYQGTSYKGETHNPVNGYGYGQFRVNATDLVNTIIGRWDSGDVDLATTGYDNYDLTLFNFKIYNNSLSPGVEPITSIRAFGNTCYYTEDRTTYASQESLNVSAVCPGPVPTTFGYLREMFTINFASFTPSTIDISNVNVVSTNGQVEKYLKDLKTEAAITNQTLTNIYNLLITNGNSAVVSAINNQTQQQAQQHQQIVNDDTSGNSNDFSSDINNFSVPNNSHALDILGTLQNFVGNIQVSGSCRRISVPIPFTDKTFILPCMTTDVYSVHFRELVVIWQVICRGVGYYYILVNVLKLVKETLDPFNFKLEVLDL